MLLSRIIEDVFRNEGRRILAGLIRLTGDIDLAEESLQDACARAMEVWDRDGIPENAGGWINTVSRRIAIDRLRRDRSTELPAGLEAPPAFDDEDLSGIDDDMLRLIFVCCHPALSPEARCGLALKLLGGLTTREIARAFVEPEATTAQRLVRAKKKIREAGIPFEIPPGNRLGERVEAVNAVIYLIFNEGYLSTESASLVRPDLCREAIRLGRLANAALPDSAETGGLLALMLLIDARQAARVTEQGDLVPLEEQDRNIWNREQIDEGVRLLETVLSRGTPGPYQVQAAIAALHAEEEEAAETDWKQISALYRTLLQMQRTPVIELNAAIALGMASKPEKALEWLAQIERRGELDRYHLLPAAKADLLRRTGRVAEATTEYERAIELATSPSERRYLESRRTECERARTPV